MHLYLNTPVLLTLLFSPSVHVKSRPHIYFCRSPNMEDFSCWWRPLENLTEEVSYVLTYSKEYVKNILNPDV